LFQNPARLPGAQRYRHKASIEERDVDEDDEATKEALGVPPASVDHPVEGRNHRHGD
jgi:hypothetical protein